MKVPESRTIFAGVDGRTDSELPEWYRERHWDADTVAFAEAVCDLPSCSAGREFITHYGGTAEGGDGALTDHICDDSGESFATSNELGGHVTAVHRRDQIVTDADVILDDIRRVADKLGKPPTAKEMSEHGEYSQRVCQNKFGSWNEALREAGYAPNSFSRQITAEYALGFDRDNR